MSVPASGYTLETSDMPAGKMRAELERQVAEAGGVRAFCRRKGIESHAAVSLALSGKRDVSESIANARGYLKISVYRKM